MTRILWLSDFHLSTEGPVLGFDSVDASRRAIEHVSAVHADAACCVVTGDLTEHGSQAEYRSLCDMLDTLPMPWLPLVGNHDSRDALRNSMQLPAQCMADFVQYRVDMHPTAAKPLTLLCLDTLIAGESGGELCTERLGWLERELHDCRDHNVLVFMHHPPVDVGVVPFDAIGLQNGEQVMAVLSAHACVAHVFAGHVHRQFNGVRQGVAFATQRSVLFQAPPPRPAWDWKRFAPAQEPAGYGVISVDANGVTVSNEQLP